MSLPQAVSAHLNGRTISAELLVHMDFRDEPRRWWTGSGWLEAAGHLWQGMGTLIAIDGLEPGPGATKTTFTLSGVDPAIIALARSAADRVAGRAATVWIQFFETEGDRLGQPLDAPVAIWAGEMDQIAYSGTGPSERRITLTAGNLWADRNRPPYGLWTDRDQQARYPGDRGWEQAPTLVNKTIRWPTF